MICNFQMIDGANWLQLHGMHPLMHEGMLHGMQWNIKLETGGVALT